MMSVSKKIKVNILNYYPASPSISEQEKHFYVTEHENPQEFLFFKFDL